MNWWIERFMPMLKSFFLFIIVIFVPTVIWAVISATLIMEALKASNFDVGVLVFGLFLTFFIPFTVIHLVSDYFEYKKGGGD